jgi:radical SAM/Cys-rich protein
MGSTSKSLKRRAHDLSDPVNQLKHLSNGIFQTGKCPTFRSKLEQQGNWPLKPASIEIFQVNVGYMCNQVCKHCHVDAGPDRREIMTRETIDQCLDAIASAEIHTLDLTGGAPEMNPDFRYFVEGARNRGVKEIIVRSNLTIFSANRKYADLPEFFKKNKVRVVSSLPYFNADRTDRQRGDGVFDRSITALKRLNELGYGLEGTGLILDLVYNPLGAFLPGDQVQLEKDFKRTLANKYGIVFNQLFAITNMPISRFLEFLDVSGNYESYMEKLVNAFNPAAVNGVMCRNTISVGYDGKLYDCDFNQMLEIPVVTPNNTHVQDFSKHGLEERVIAVHQHCYGCTAGAGSSCQGEVA